MDKWFRAVVIIIALVLLAAHIWSEATVILTSGGILRVNKLTGQVRVYDISEAIWERPRSLF